MLWNVSKLFLQSLQSLPITTQENALIIKFRLVKSIFQHKKASCNLLYKVFVFRIANMPPSHRYQGCNAPHPKYAECMFRCIVPNDGPNNNHHHKHSHVDGHGHGHGQCHKESCHQFCDQSSRMGGDLLGECEMEEEEGKPVTSKCYGTNMTEDLQEHRGCSSCCTIVRPNVGY